MASTWRRAMLYLGLGPDEDYEDFVSEDERAAVIAPETRRPPTRPAPREPGDAPVRPMPSQAPEGQMVQGKPTRPAVVRPLPAPNAKPHVVAPVSFNDVQEVADKYKASQPVIVNLQGADRDLSRRLIDFASGLCYGLGGHMEKVAGQVYLLTPTNVEVSAEERRRLQERGYDA